MESSTGLGGPIERGRRELRFVKTVGDVLGRKSMPHDLVWVVNIKVVVDRTSATGIASRDGFGNV